MPSTNSNSYLARPCPYVKVWAYLHVEDMKMKWASLTSDVSPDGNVHKLSMLFIKCIPIPTIIQGIREWFIFNRLENIKIEN